MTEIIRTNELKILDIFTEISRYKILSGTSEREKQKEIYVDPLPSNTIVYQLLNVKKRNKVIFLVGRRGSGKTTIINRVRIEGIESFINPANLIYWKQYKNSKFVPIYIDIRSLVRNILSEMQNLNYDKPEFVSQIAKRILIEIFSKIIEFFEIIYDNDTSFKKKMKEISNIYDEFKNKIRNIHYVVGDKKEQLKSFFGNLFEAIRSIDVKQIGGLKIEYKYIEKNWLNIFPVDLFLENIKKVKNIIPEIEFFYILIDEFSEISSVVQDLFINSFITPLYKNDDNKHLYFCLSCYPALYTTGDLLFGNDCDKIELDWFALVQNTDDYEENLKNSIEYMKSIIQKRLNYYFKSESDKILLSDIFDENDPDIYKYLFYSTMNIPRFIGEIFKSKSCENSIISKKKIKSSDIKEGSKYIYGKQLILNYFTSKIYFPEEEINLDKNLWDSLIQIFRTRVFRESDYNGVFLCDEELFDKENPIFIRLEMMGFLFKIGSVKSKHPYKIRNEPMDLRRQSIYSIYYGALINFNLDKKVNKFPINMNLREIRERDKLYHLTKKIIDFFQGKKFYRCPVCYKVESILNKELLEFAKYRCVNTEDCENQRARFEEIILPSRQDLTIEYIEDLETKLEDEDDKNVKQQIEIFKRFDEIYSSIKNQINDINKIILFTLYKNRDQELTSNEIAKEKRITSYEYSYQKVAGNIKKLITLELIKINKIKGRSASYFIEERGINFVDYLNSIEQIEGIS